LELFSPKNCYKHSHKLRTVKDVLNLPSKTLGQFKNEFGKDWVVGYLEMWLIELNDSTNVKTKMNPAQMEFTAIRIYESYSLKITDLTLFFRNIKEGVYGPFYENLSTDKIMSWLKEYYDLRCEYAQMYASNQHEKFSASKDKINPEVISEMFKGVGTEKVEFNHEKNTLGKRTKKVVVKDLIIEIKSWTTEDLREYLIKNDIESNNYSQTITKLIEAEIDLRNKI